MSVFTKNLEGCNSLNCNMPDFLTDAGMVIFMWWTMITPIGRCMPSVEVPTPPLTVREIGISPLPIPSQKRYILPINFVSMVFVCNLPTIEKHNTALIPCMVDQVTKRVDTATSKWKGWNWRSEGDLLLNGAYFTPSGAGASASYSRASSLGAKSSSMVGAITSGAGVLSCRRGSTC